MSVNCYLFLLTFLRLLLPLVCLHIFVNENAFFIAMYLFLFYSG